MRYPKRVKLDELLATVDTQKKAALPFVVYRHPNTLNIMGLFQDNDVLHHTHDFSESGFVFSPFDNQQATLLIPTDNHFEATSGKFEVSHRTEVFASEKGKHDHMNLVKKGISLIKKGVVKKIVLSRKISVKTFEEGVPIFLRALEAYPDAFCYLWYHPKVGMWVGATPERLLQIRGNRMKTTSLAGTLAVEPDKNPDWSQKELEEQKMVTDYLLDQLKNEVSEVKVSETKSVRAGQLWHLKTDIHANLPLGANLRQVVSKIHPTPAVCGLPTQEAKKFILGHEGYDRTYYTGFLGELNLSETGAADLYVNLRCMQIEHNEVFIYVGGGITKDSNPEKEWMETENKSKTMRSLL